MIRLTFRGPMRIWDNQNVPFQIPPERSSRTGRASLPVRPACLPVRQAGRQAGRRWAAQGCRQEGYPVLQHGRGPHSTGGEIHKTKDFLKESHAEKR